MENLVALVNLIKAHWKDVADIIAYLVALASIVVKLTPTLKDDNYLKPIIKFIGKYIALDKYSPTSGEK